MARLQTCTKCGGEGAVLPDERIGRTLHTVCLQCGWCATHDNYWLINGQRGPQEAASEPATTTAVETAA